MTQKSYDEIERDIGVRLEDFQRIMKDGMMCLNTLDEKDDPYFGFINELTKEILPDLMGMMPVDECYASLDSILFDLDIFTKHLRELVSNARTGSEIDRSLVIGFCARMLGMK